MLYPKSNFNKTQKSYALWTQHKPDIDHLRIFGCTCYVHILLKNKRSGTLKQLNVFSLGMENKELKRYKLYDH